MRLFLACALLLSSPALRADLFSDHDSSPLTGIFGLPDALESGELLAKGRSSFEFNLQTASHSVGEEAGLETLIVDGETSRIDLLWKRGIGDRLELGVEIPWLTHQAGGLDSVIDEWHSIFGLPEGERPERPRDLLEFVYADADGVGLNRTARSNGIGDLRVTLGYRLSSTPIDSKGGARHTALRFGLKLPTGDDANLHGSGGTDVSVGIAGDYLGLGRHGSWSAYYRLHGTYLGEPRFLRRRHESIVAQAVGGISWRPHDVVSLTAQLALRSGLYDSDIEMLGGPAMSLTFGALFRVGERVELSLAVGEDVIVESTPDVTFQLGVRLLPSETDR